MSSPLIAQAVLHGLWQGLVLVAILAVAIRAMRGLSAATRYRLWFVGTLVIAVLPLIDLAAWSLRPSPSPALAPGPGVVPKLTVPADVFGVLGVLWSVATLALVARVGVSFVRLRLLRRHAQRLVDLEPELTRLAAAIGLRRPVQIYASTRVRSPLAIGLGRDAIVIPAPMLAALDAANLEHVCVHELAHLRRRDDLTNLAAKLLRAVFFFNPALVIAERALHFEREIACDDWVIATCGKPRRYANYLAQFLDAAPVRPIAALRLLLPPNESVRRIALLLDKDRNREPNLGKRTAFAALALWATGVVAIAQTPPVVTFAIAIDDLTRIPSLAALPLPAIVHPVVAARSRPRLLRASVTTPHPVVAAAPVSHPRPIRVAARPQPRVVARVVAEPVRASRGVPRAVTAAVVRAAVDSPAPLVVATPEIRAVSQGAVAVSPPVVTTVNVASEAASPATAASMAAANAAANVVAGPHARANTNAVVASGGSSTGTVTGVPAAPPPVAGAPGGGGVGTGSGTGTGVVTPVVIRPVVTSVAPVGAHVILTGRISR